MSPEPSRRRRNGRWPRSRPPAGPRYARCAGWSGDSAGPGLEPAPGLADLGRLITGTADAGVRVRLDARGTPGSVPPGVGLAAYRIVQEALTNVVKHAQTTESRVVVTYEQDAICLEITDEGHGAADAPGQLARAGHGIAGMRERAGLYG